MIGSIVGGLAKIIFSPIAKLLMTLFYGILIRGPLWLLNTLDHVFQFASGSKVDKMLFDTSLVDGKPQLNFFVSSSPLKYYFLIVLGIAGTLLILFIGFAIASSITNKKNGGPLRKVGRVALSSSVVFAVPAMFLVVLSLSGGLMGAISGQHKALGSKGISGYQTTTQQRINRIKDTVTTAPNIYEKSSKNLNGLTDESGKNHIYSLDQVYDNFNIKKWVLPSSTLVASSEQARDAFKTFRNLLINPGSQDLNVDLKNSFDDVSGIIGSLTPKIKDEDMADKVKALQDRLQNLNDVATNFIEKSNDLLSNLNPNSKVKDGSYYALMNYKLYFDYIMGPKLANKPSIQSISSLREFLFEINSLVAGDITNSNTGLLGLRQNLSDFKDNSLVVTFYHIATGNTDTNWDRSISTLHNGGFMLLIGFFLIMGAAIIMTMAILFAITRIFDLALLFIVSPAVIVSSIFDDGQRMKMWVNITIAKLISIFGIVISLRLFGVLNDQFVEGINNSGMDSGSTGYLVANLAIGMFGLGGMLAAYRSSQTLSSIVGAGQGIMAGLQARETMSVLRAGFNPIKRLGGRALGIKSARARNTPSRARNTGRGPNSPGGSSRSALGSIGETWKGRIQAPVNAVTALSGGRLGTGRSRMDHVNKKIEKSKQSLSRAQIKTASPHINALKKGEINKDKATKKDLLSEYRSSKKRSTKAPVSTATSLFGKRLETSDSRVDHTNNKINKDNAPTKTSLSQYKSDKKKSSKKGRK